MSLWLRERDNSPALESSPDATETKFVRRGNGQYAIEKGENSAQESYQEASGAPVESRSPLGYHVGTVTIVFLNLSKMIGTGVYSTPATILRNTGSVGLALIYWFIGFLIAAASLSVYLEFASYFPNRSGSDVVYLEQSFPRPRYLFPVIFAIQSVVFAFSASNAIVLAEYMFRIGNHTPTAWEQKGVAVAGYTLAFLVVVFSTRWSYAISNVIGAIKLFTLIFVAITGLVVLGGNVSRIPHPTANFHDSFSMIAGTTLSVSGCTSALYKIIFAYAGYDNAFNVVNEVKVSFLLSQYLKHFAHKQDSVGTKDIQEAAENLPIASARSCSFPTLTIQPLCAIISVGFMAYTRGKEHNLAGVIGWSPNPVRTIRNSGGSALLLVVTLYMLANVAYLAAVPKEQLIEAKEIAASLFFERVFGSGSAVKGLNFLIALSAFGALLSGLLGSSRMIRECGRQGTLPFPSFWVNTQPFGTPIGPYFVKWVMTMVMILAPPAGDAFNFVVDLAIYPSAFFSFLIALGIYSVRRQRKKLDIPDAAKGHSFKTWHMAIVFTVLINIFVLIMPWYPPPGGKYGGDVSFWYATYAATGIGILVTCGLYYVLWVHTIPRWRGYRMRHRKVVLKGGEVTHILVKVPLGELQAWDETHNTQGEHTAIGDTSSDERVAAVELQPQEAPKL